MQGIWPASASFPTRLQHPHLGFQRPAGALLRPARRVPGLKELPLQGHLVSVAHLQHMHACVSMCVRVHAFVCACVRNCVNVHVCGGDRSPLKRLLVVVPENGVVYPMEGCTG